MAGFDEFADVIKRNESLAPYTYLKVGGPAEMLIQPRSREELSRVVQRCFEERVPMRVLGSGCNLLVRDEGVRGAVLRLSEPVFTEITIDGKRVRAGTGAPVSALISASARHGLAGLETLVGIPGTVGGALRTNAGDHRTGDIGQFVRQVEVLDRRGGVQVRDRDELHFQEHASNLDDPVILTAEFALEPDQADAIVKRMRKAWILRKGGQPLGFQSAGRVFKNPRGLSARELLDQAGLARTRVGGAEVSDRDSNYVVVHEGASSRDVLRLIDLMYSRVRERFNIDLEREMAVW
ncbi:MAG TPA: UDP-N-acetylmuramate dehydrogenase [Gemmataceae bacterium]|nr:UDP-N-acetylmuramate dehydrogenase [Gemmataceae bacterium]